LSSRSPTWARPRRRRDRPQPGQRGAGRRRAREPARRYYDSDAPFFNGIVGIGQLDSDIDALERQTENFSDTIERAA
jgi:hypothetical protein